MLLPESYLPLVQELRGQQHTLDHTLFIGGTLFVKFSSSVEKPQLLEPQYIPSSILDHLTLVSESRALLGSVILGAPQGSVPSLHVTVNGMLIIPGWEYLHENGTHYEVLAIANIDRDPAKAEAYPFYIVYRAVGKQPVWTKRLAEFCNSFTLVNDQPHSTMSKIELVSALNIVSTPIDGELYFNWDSPNVSSGSINITGKSANLLIQSENKNKRFIKAALCSLVDKADLKEV